MSLDVGRVWPEPLILRQVNPVHLAIEKDTQLSGDLVVRNEQPVFIGKGDQMSVKKPMHGSGQGDTVLHNIGPNFSHSPDMGGLHLRPATAIDDPKPTHGASVTVCIADMPPKVGVPDLAVHEHLLDPSDLIESGQIVEIKSPSGLFNANEAKSNCIIRRKRL